MINSAVDFGRIILRKCILTLIPTYLNFSEMLNYKKKQTKNNEKNKQNKNNKKKQQNQQQQQENRSIGP